MIRPAVRALYGVYEFLERTIDFDVYGPDVIGYQEDLQEIPLYNFNLIDVPDVSYRMNGYGFFGGQNDLSDDARRLRIDPSPIANIVGSWAHNTFEFFSAELFEQNPEWKGTDGEQLCYLARGNQEKYEDMQKHVLDQITSYLETDKDCIYIPFMQEDINSWCNCDECNKTISKYGGYATSTQIIFCNDLGDKLQVWIDKNQPGRDVKIIMFAYHKTTQAPAVKNAAGAFEPVHQDMRLRDNVGVFYAPITANYYYPLNHEENLSFYEIIQGWASVTDNCLWWLYSTNFYHYLFFFDNFGGMYETYKMMEDYNVELVFENTQYGQKAATAFHVLKAYLNAKLAWDGDQDYEALIDKWFKGYFKEAAPHMKKLFDSIRYRVAIVNAGGDYNIGDVFEGIGDNKEMWPYANLLQWENIINEAYDSIAGLRLENPAEYSAIHDRINLESVFVRYAQIVLYGDRYSSEVLAEMKKSFKADVMRLGVNQVAEDINLIGVVGNW